MKALNIYRIISYIMTVLFIIGIICTITTATLFTAITIDPSIIPNEPGDYRLSIGVLQFHIADTMIAKPALMMYPLVLVFPTFIFWNFRVLFKNLAARKLFVHSNTKSIFGMGFVLLIASFINSIPDLLVAKKIISSMHFKGRVETLYTVNTSLLLASIFIILLGFFFHKAVQIAQENELTI
ncbi:hypothetical protein ACFQZ1_09700 [Bacillus sp. CGMCC 1.60114]|uniref:hypothetical protein n=1 Tax=unclassified Bacillus (in: firmicutes) TaxID=185979 RepID=UPI00363A675C